MPDLSLTLYSDVTDFLKRATPFLTRREAASGLPLGFALMIERNPHQFQDCLLLTLAQDGQVIVAGVQIGVRPMVFEVDCACVSAEIIPYLAQQLAQRRAALGGIQTAKENARLFTQTWINYTGQTVAKRMAQKVMRIEQVITPQKVAGSLRQATYNDTPLVVDWANAFQLEALGEPADMQAYAERAVHDGAVYLWIVDGEVVSMARWQRPLLHGVTISLVYTPPAQRGNGYASACVAALSQLMLDTGWQFCTLFTDAANPTSNKIYQQIGYKVIEEQAQIVFGA